MQMLAQGNGHPAQCALNLLRTFRGEVPYARTKGIDRSLIDIPATESWRLRVDAEWVIEQYEPRISMDDVDLSALDGPLGDLAADFQTTTR